MAAPPCALPVQAPPPLRSVSTRWHRRPAGAAVCPPPRPGYGILPSPGRPRAIASLMAGGGAGCRTPGRCGPARPDGLAAVRIAAISRPFGRISESPADPWPPVAPIVLACGCARSSRRAAMVSPWGELRPWRAVVGGVGGEAIARAASDDPTARHLPPVSCGKRRAHDAPGKLRRGPRAAAAGVLLLISLLASWNWPAAKDKL